MLPANMRNVAAGLQNLRFRLQAEAEIFTFWSFRFHFLTVAGIWSEITFGKQPDPMSDLRRVIAADF